MYREKLKWWEWIVYPTIWFGGLAVYGLTTEAATEIGGFIGFLIFAVATSALIIVLKKTFPK